MARRSSHDRDALDAARRKKQEKYWSDRAQSRIRATDRDADMVKREQDRAYKTARENVQREIDKFYRDFGNAAGMSEEEVRQKLSRGELKDFKAELERKRRIIQEMIKKDPNNKALKRYDMEWENLSKVRELTRKEALETNVAAEIAQIGGKQQMSMDSHLNKVIDTSLKMNADDLKKLGNVDVKLGVGSPEQVKRAAKENWQHSDFSDRIWADKEKLIKEAREVIEQGFANNKGAMDMATDLMVRMNVSHSNALRVVRTEFNHLSNQAALAEYKSSGIKKYKFVSAIDNRTCSVCHGLNGKEFLVSEAKTGVNFPPIHPNCRSVTVPVIDWGDKDQWDYSNIELDDAELAELGLTREEVKALDASAPELPKDAPKPTLTAREADKAANDTQSVKRRAEQAEKRAQIESDIEVDAHRQLEAIDQVKTKMDQLEDINRRLEKEGAPMTLPRAAIVAERLEEIGIDIKEQELEAVKLQERAARIDDTVPKPDENAVEQLQTAIDEAKTRRAERQKKDLPDAEIIVQALPQIAVEKSEPNAEDAVAPQSRAGKLWVRVKAEVEKAWKKFNHAITGLIEKSPVFRMSKPDDLNTMDVDQDVERLNFENNIRSLRQIVEDAKMHGKKADPSKERKLAFYEGILKNCEILPSRELANKAFEYKEKYFKKYGEDLPIVFASSKGRLKTKGTGEFEPEGETGIVRLMFNAKPHVAAHEITHAMHYKMCPYAYLDLREKIAEELGIDTDSLSEDESDILDEFYEHQMKKLLKTDPFVQAASSDWAKLRKAYGVEAEWTVDSANEFKKKFNEEVLNDVFNGKEEYQLNETERMQFMALNEIVCSFAQDKHFEYGHKFEEYGKFHHEAVASLIQLLDNGNEKINKILENRFGDFLNNFLLNLR